MSNFQPGILPLVPAHTRYLTFRLRTPIDKARTLERLGSLEITGNVIGLGNALQQHLHHPVAQMKYPHPEQAGTIEIPASTNDLWCWLQGDDRGELLHRSRAITAHLADTFEMIDCIDAYCYDNGRDLTGYQDGTENPQGEAALSAAFLASEDMHLDGSSFVAVQQWQHDLDSFAMLDQSQQDDVFGRRRSDNEEFDAAPETAHVKRTAQESFDPEAFVLRRSMPWHHQMQAGIVFVAFGRSFDAFEALFARMLGKEDGLIDNLFQFSRPLSTAYYWCPPVKDGRLNLQALSAD